MPKSFLQANKIKKYQLRNMSNPSKKLSGHYFQNLLQGNLGADPRVFKNKNSEVRKTKLHRKEMPRRDSEENLSFWTKNIKRKFNEENDIKVIISRNSNDQQAKTTPASPPQEMQQ